MTVLSTDDPVRVFQRFSTVNALSGERAEVILGRGSFTGRTRCSGTTWHSTVELFEEKLSPGLRNC